MPYLYHLSCQRNWEPNLAPASLCREGYVHLCTLEQLIATAERWFPDREQLKVLQLDRDLLEPALRWEDSYGHGQAFPHHYGALPEASVRAVLEMRRSDGGGPLRLPETLERLADLR